MNAKTRITLIISFVTVILLFLLFSSMVITGTMSNAGMMESQRISGFGWMWIPTVLTLGLGILLGWAAFSGNASKA